MKNRFVSLLCIVLCCALLAACGGGADSSSVAPVAASERTPDLNFDNATVEDVPTYSLNFTLHNFSNAALTDIRISRSDQSDYGPNLLPQGYVLPDGNMVDIVFDSEAPAGTTFDMYTLDDDGDAYEYYDIPLTQITKLSIYVTFYNNGTYNNYFEYE